MRVFSVIRSPPRSALPRFMRRASEARASTWSLLKRASLRWSTRYLGRAGAGGGGAAVLPPAESCAGDADTLSPPPSPFGLSRSLCPAVVTVSAPGPSSSRSSGAFPTSPIRSASPRRRLPPISPSSRLGHHQDRRVPHLPPVCSRLGVPPATQSESAYRDAQERG